MARKRVQIRMADGFFVNDLDEMKEHFDIESVTKHFQSGDLLSWLNDRYYEDEVEQLEQLAADDPQLQQKLGVIFGVESGEELDPEQQERLEQLKLYTDDPKILAEVASVAFDQADLGERLDEGKSLIYLCNNRFTIPLRQKDKTYIGIGNAVAVIRSNKPVDFDAVNIRFQDIAFDDKYAAIAPSSPNVPAPLPTTTVDAKKFCDEGRAAEDHEDWKTALEKFKQAAELGYVPAFAEVGTYYKYGFDNDDYEGDIDEARRWYKLGMDKGDGNSFGHYAATFKFDAPESEKHEAFKCMKRATELRPDNGPWWFYLGDMYRKGQGTQKDIAKAVDCYEKGTDAGSPAAANKLGEMYLDGEDVDQNLFKAAELFQKALEFNGDYDDALENLAYCYRYGKGVPEDKARAFELYKRSAESELVTGKNAMYFLGYMLFAGEGVDKNDEEAFYWTKKAVDLGNTDAFYNLAYFYREGVGTAPDPYKAIVLYEKAANFGNINALVDLGEMFRFGEGVAQDFSKAADYFQQAADRGNTDGLNQLGLMYDNGEGVRQDSVKAFQFFLQAAEAGNANAMSNLSLCYLWGDGGRRKDLNLAEYRMYKAADNGNYVAMVQYANTLFSQNPNDRRLFKLYETAADAGYGEAAYRLGVMYAVGCGTQKNKAVSKYWFQQATDFGYEPDDATVAQIKSEIENAD